MGCGTLVGLGLAGAGAGVNMYANDKVRGNMDDVYNQEMLRNQQYQKQGQQTFQNSLAQSTPTAAKQQIGQGQQQLAGLIQNAQAVPMSASMPSFGNVNTQGQQDRKEMSNSAAANMGGYSNLSLQQRLKDMDTSNQLGVINNNAQGWANVLPAQLQQAQQSEQGLQSIGSLLGTAGMLTGMGSATAAPGIGQVPNYTMDGMGMPNYFNPSMYNNMAWMQ